MIYYMRVYNAVSARNKFISHKIVDYEQENKTFSVSTYLNPGNGVAPSSTPRCSSY